VQAFLPPPARPLVLELLESLPAKLCAQPPAAVAGVPAATNDQACPFGLVAAPARAAAAGLRPWGLAIAAAAFDADLRWGAPAPERPGYVATFDGQNLTIEYPGHPGLNASSGDPQAVLDALQRTAPQYRQAYARARLWAWAQRMCALLYAPGAL
jgi:hypothetical protein